MSACNVSTQPSSDMIMYCGMTASWVGTVMVSTTMRNSVFRPGKRSLAKAYPASAHSTPCPTPIATATTALLTSDRTKGTVLNTSSLRWNRFSPGRILGGILYAVAESFEATTNIQYSGKTATSTASTSST